MRTENVNSIERIDRAGLQASKAARSPSTGRGTSRLAVGIACVMLGLGASSAQALVRFDNFRGSQNVPTPIVEPSYANYVGGQHDVQIQNLISFAAGPSANIASSGTASNIDWTQASNTLCNNGTGSQACDQRLQGRVTYALVKFPTAGTYYFGAAHDDEVKIEFSTTFASMDPANYRSYDYNVPVGGVGPWTSGDNGYDHIPGNFVVSQAGACHAMRIYWNNQGGINLLRLGWRNTTPPQVATAQDYPFIPDEYLRDPADPNSYADCAVVDTDLSINKTGPTTFQTGVRFNPAYTITLWNQGPNPLSNATFADTLPEGLDVHGFTCAAFDANGNLMSNGAANLTVSERNSAYAVTMGGLLEVNASTSTPTTGPRLECTVDVTPTTTALSITNTATITVNDRDTTNNTSSWTSVREDVVSVTKTGPASAVVGQGFTYQLTVANNSGSTKNGIIVLDQLPPSVTATSAAVSEGTVSCTDLGVAGALLSCTLNQNAPDFLTGTSRVITLGVSASAPGAITNHAATAPGGSGTPESNPGPLCNTATTSCANARTTLMMPPTLTLIKQVIGGTATPNDFTLTANGPTAITGISGSPAVTQAVVSEGTYDLSEQSAVAGYAAGTWSCTINGGTPADGASVSVVNGQNAACTITNSAALLTVTKTLEGTTFDAPTAFEFSVSCEAPSATYSGTIQLPANTATAQTTVNIPAGSTNCQITENLASRPAAPVNFSWEAPRYVQPSPDALAAGGTATAGITNPLLRNQIAVAITKNVTGAPASGAPGSYGFSLVCDTGTYEGAVTLSGTDVTGSATVSVPQGAACSALNETSKAAAPTGHSWGTETTVPPAGLIGADSKGVITNPLNAPVLTVTKSADRKSAAQGGAITYTVRIGNSGTVSSGANTTVVDKVPAGLKIMGVSPGSGWSCTPTSGTGALDISCVKAAGVAAGTTDELVATLMATKSNSSDITNTANVTTGDISCEATPAAARCTSSVTVTTEVPATPTPVPVNSRAMLALMALLVIAAAAWQARGKVRKG